MEGLTEGRIVHYVLESGRSQGAHRPAIVVRNWSNSGDSYPDGTVNLQVFTDGHNDGFMLDAAEGNPQAAANTIWRTSVHYSENKEPRTWHWIEKV